MQKNVLFLLQAGFNDDQGGPYFCPDCAMVEGFLKYAPEVAQQLEVHRVDFKKPRQPVIELLGSARQGCPTLVLVATAALPADAQCSEETGRYFIAGSTAICDYLGRTFGTVRPHA